MGVLRRVRGQPSRGALPGRGDHPGGGHALPDAALATDSSRVRLPTWSVSSVRLGPDAQVVGADRALGGPVPDGPGPVGDERLDLATRRRFRHQRDHDPGGDHALLAGDGGADDHRRQARRPLGPPARVHGRPRHLRLRLRAHRRFLERAEPGARLVGARGDRRGDGPSGPGGADRGQLRGPRSRDRLRRPRRRRRRRDRGRPDPRRLADHLRLLAGGLRRRGGAGDRDLARDAPAARAPSGRPPRRPRLGRLGALGARARADRVRRPPGQQLGLAGAAQLPGRAVRVLARPVRDRRRRRAAARVSRLGASPRDRQARAPGAFSTITTAPPCAAAWRCSAPRT